MESIVRRDRRVVLACLAVITVLAWSYLVGMGGMSVGDAAAKPWAAFDFAVSLAMWAAMMMAMMVPTASPMVLMFARTNRRWRRQDGAVVPTGIFVAGYIAVWLAFSVAATVLQWGFQSVGLISPMVGKANIVFGGLVLVAAGLYQWTPFKDACLRLCQTPLGFLMTRWREGAGGAFRMGLAHGAYCVGCCWALMALMFVGGVMNLLWMGLLAVFMLAEKLAPPGHWMSRVAGIVLVTWGGWTLGVSL